MAQDNMASLVNIAKIKPEERSQTSASFNESNFVGGNIQIGAPSQQIGKTDDQAMFESLAAISSGVEVGISNYMKVAETVDKETVSKVKAQWATIDAQEINPKEKMKQLNEVLAQAKTPFIGYTWREEAHAVASKSWGTPAYEEYIKTDFDTFLLNHPKYTENMGPSLRKAMVSEYLQENPSAEASLYLKKTTGEAEAILSNMAADRMILQVSTSIVLPYDIDQKKQEGLLSGTFSLESLEKEAPAYHAALVKARDSADKQKFYNSFIDDTMISLEKMSDGLTEEQYEKLFLQLKARLVPIAQQIYATSEIMQANAEDREVVQSVGILIQDTSEHGIDSANLDPVVNTLWQSMSISDPKAQYATIMGFTNAYYNSINDDTNKDSKGMSLIEKDEHFNITIKAIFQDLINTGTINPASFGVKVLKSEEILRQFKNPTMMTAKRDQLTKQMASAAKTISLASRQGGEQQQLPPQQAFQDIFIKKTGATQAQADKIFPKEVRKKTADGDTVVYTPSSEILEDKAISVLLERLGITKPEELDELREHFSQASILTGSGGGSNSSGDYKSKTPTPHAAIESIVNDPFSGIGLRDYYLENPGVLDPNTAIGKGHINIMDVLNSADIGLNYALRQQIQNRIFEEMKKKDVFPSGLLAALDRTAKRNIPDGDQKWDNQIGYTIKDDKIKVDALNKKIDEEFTQTFGVPVFDINKPETSLLWGSGDGKADLFTFEMLMNTRHHNEEFVDKTGELKPKPRLALARIAALAALAARVPESDGTQKMVGLVQKALNYVKDNRSEETPPELLHSLVAVLRGFGDSGIDAAMLTGPDSTQDDILFSGMMKYVAGQPIATNTNEILGRSKLFIYSLQVLNKAYLAESSKDTFETHNQQVFSNQEASLDVVTKESIKHFMSGIMFDNPRGSSSSEQEIVLWTKQYKSQESKGWDGKVVAGSSITNMFVAWLGLDDRRFTKDGKVVDVDPIEVLLAPILSPGDKKARFLTPGFNGFVKVVGVAEPIAYTKLTKDQRSSFLIATAYESDPEGVILAIKLAIIAKQKFPEGSTGVSITKRAEIVEGLISTSLNVNRKQGVLLSEIQYGIGFNPASSSYWSVGTGFFDKNSSSSLGSKEVLPTSRDKPASYYLDDVDSPLLLFNITPDMENKLEELGGDWEERFNAGMAALGNVTEGKGFKKLSAADCYVIGALTGQCNKGHMKWLNETLKLGLTTAQIDLVPSLPTTTLLSYLLDGKEYSGDVEKRLLQFGIGTNAENKNRVRFTTTIDRDNALLRIDGTKSSVMFLDLPPYFLRINLEKYLKPEDTSYQDAVRTVYILESIASLARIYNMSKNNTVEDINNTGEENYNEDAVTSDRAHGDRP